jgi:hypothetical protein
MTETKPPTIKQMKARMLSGHSQALAAISNGVNPFHPNLRASEIKGLRTAIGTLQKWGAVVQNQGHYELTETGRALL